MTDGTVSVTWTSWDYEPFYLIRLHVRGAFRTDSGRYASPEPQLERTGNARRS